MDLNTLNEPEKRAQPVVRSVPSLQHTATILPAPGQLYSLTAQRISRWTTGEESGPGFLQTCDEDDSFFWIDWMGSDRVPDGNGALAKHVRQQNRRRRLGRILKGLIPGVELAAAYQEIPEKRRFRWSITSQHVAKGCQDPSRRIQSPWLAKTRFMMMDISDPINDPSFKTWREYQLPLQKNGRFTRGYSGVRGRSCEMKWGRRAYF